MCCSVLIASASLFLLASGKSTFVFSPDGRFVGATETSSRTLVAPEGSSGLKTIAGNLSSYKDAKYFSVFGNTIAQGGSNYPFQEWLAEAFTPTADASVTKVEVSVGRLSGTTGVEVALYSDAGGIPGTLIKSFHVSSLPTYGQCCALASATDKTGIPVRGGTQYWLVVSTTAKDTDLYAWAFNSTNMTPQLNAYWCEGSSTYCGTNSGKWVANSYVQWGYAVLGK